jgi:hypothetical protein
MAFDISYKYMANDEQNFVMERLAELEQEGRIEALRERRNHFHVYAFSDGERPSEPLVASLLDDVQAANPGAYARPAARKPAARKPAARKAGSRKAAPKARRTSNAQRRR